MLLASSNDAPQHLVVFSIITIAQLPKRIGATMGLTYADLKLTNLFTNQSVTVRALVDSGATFMCVTEEIAHQLGFDPSEVSTQFVHTADGRQLKVPKIAPIEIAFENRTYVTEALVMVLSQSLFLMNWESCRSLNLWSQFFDFARKTQLCDRTVPCWANLLDEAKSLLAGRAIALPPTRYHRISCKL